MYRENTGVQGMVSGVGPSEYKSQPHHYQLYSPESLEKEPSLHFIFKTRTIPWLRKLFVELNNKLTEILAHSKHVTKMSCWHYMGIYTLYRFLSLTCIHFEMKMRKGEERDCKFLRYVITQ